MAAPMIIPILVFGAQPLAYINSLAKLIWVKVSQIILSSNQTQIMFWVSDSFKYNFDTKKKVQPTIISFCKFDILKKIVQTTLIIY